MEDDEELAIVPDAEEDEHEALPLPSFQNQVAGHKGISHEGGAILVPEPGKIAKPVGRGYFAGEDRFYRELHLHPSLAAFCPAYFGTQTLAGRDYVILEDLTYGMERPFVVDIKVGTCTVAPDAPWTKRMTHLAKDRTTTTRSLGLRIVGAQNHSAGRTARSNPIRIGKRWGKALQPQDMGAALRSCFSDESGHLCSAALRTFVPKLVELAQVLEAKPRWQLVSSSLLFVFQSDDDAKAARAAQQQQQQQQDRQVQGAAGDGGTPCAPHAMRIIDFAHAYPLRHAKRDAGYLYGLYNLIRILRSFLDESGQGHSLAKLPPPPTQPACANFEVNLSLAEGEIGHRQPGHDGVERLETSPGPWGRVVLYADEFLEAFSHSPLGGWSSEWLGFVAAPLDGAPVSKRILAARRADAPTLRFRLGAPCDGAAPPHPATVAADVEERVRGFLSALTPSEAEAVCARFSAQTAALIADLSEGAHFSFASAALTIPSARSGDAPHAQLGEFAGMALERDLSCNQACLSTLHAIHTSLSMLTFV